MIKYDQPIFRPPSERNSLLIQITLGCSHNKCTFCGMYKNKKFKIKTIEEIAVDIKDAKNYVDKSKEVLTKAFFCDGDALCAPTSLIISVIRLVKEQFPHITRFGIYATVSNILAKSLDELSLLKEEGLSICYIGLESGSDEVLQLIKKGNTKSEALLAGNMLKKSDIKISLIALLGVGGTLYSSSHARETADVISKIIPQFLSFLTTTLVPGTPLDQLIRQKKVQMLSYKELLVEMKEMIEHVNVDENRIIFRANHVSNSFPLSGIFSKDKNKMLGVMDLWIKECPEGVYPHMDYRFL